MVTLNGKIILLIQLERSDYYSIHLKVKTLSNILSPTTMRLVFIAIAQSLYSYGIGSPING